MSNKLKIYPKGKATTIKYQRGLIERAKVQNERLVGDLIKTVKELYRLDPDNKLFDETEEGCLEPVLVDNLKNGNI